MGDKIYVPYQEAESEFVEKRSRFIGHIWPVDSEDQAQELIRRVKKQHYDARHNCWCYLLGGTVDGIDYGAEVTLILSLPEDAPRRLQDRLTELSAGRLRLELSGTELRPGPREEI